MSELCSLIGKPWAVPCDPPNSFDCWELVRYVRAIYGLVTPSVIDVSERAPKHRKHITNPPVGWLKLSEVVDHCVVRMGGTHVGLYLGRGNIIHAQLGHGVRIDHVRFITEPITFWERVDD